MNRCFSWDEIRKTAETLGCEIDGVEHYVWDKPTEIEWAKKAWNALSRKGLNSYENPCDKTYIKLQILTLAAMFCKYMEVRYDISVLIDYFDWFETAEIDQIHLENITGREVTNTLEEDEVLREIHSPIGEAVEEVYDQEATLVYQDIAPEKVSEALHAVIRLQTKQVFDALSSEFNGSGLLFISLLQTQIDKRCLEWIENGMLPECRKISQNYS